MIYLIVNSLFLLKNINNLHIHDLVSVLKMYIKHIFYSQCAENIYIHVIFYSQCVENVY